MYTRQSLQHRFDLVYLREELCKFKGDVKTAVYRWITSMIDQLFAGKAGLEPVAYYAKNGISNVIDRYDEQLNRYIDYAVMFVTDKEGRIDTDKLIGDLVEIYRSTEKRTEVLLGMKVEYGAGEIVVFPPDNPFVNILLPWQSIKITAEDILKMRSFF